MNLLGSPYLDACIETTQGGCCMVTHVSSKRQNEAAVVQDIKCRCCCSTNRFRIKFNYMQNTHGPSMCGWQL